MALPPIPVHRHLREARRRKGWTQEQLAAAIGATQPAISMFEKGATEALSQEKIHAIADALGVDRASATVKARRGRRFLAPRLWYCPNPDCLSNLPCDIEGALRLLPVMVRAAADRLRCAYCGEMLLDRCPHCHAPVVEGVFCTNADCGEPRVSSLEDTEGFEDLTEWADAERARRHQIRLMAAATDHPPAMRTTPGKPRREEGEESTGQEE